MKTRLVFLALAVVLVFALAGCRAEPAPPAPAATPTPDVPAEKLQPEPTTVAGGDTTPDPFDVSKIRAIPEAEVATDGQRPGADETVPNPLLAAGVTVKTPPPPPKQDAPPIPEPGSVTAPPEKVYPRSLPEDAAEAAAVLADLMPFVQEKGKQRYRFSDQHQPFLEVLKKIGIKSDDAVADIGAGTGVLVLSMIENAQRFRRYFAVDVNKPGLDLLAETLKAKDVTLGGKYEIIHSTVADTKLPPNSVNVAVIFDSPFFLPEIDPQTGEAPTEPLAEDAPAIQCLKTLHAALIDGGRVEVVMQKVNLPMEYRSDVDIFSKTFKLAGFTFASKEIFETGAGQYLRLVFRK
jgi:Methyltransferase small domain